MTWALTFTLGALLKFGDFQELEYKLTLFIYMSLNCQCFIGLCFECACANVFVFCYYSECWRIFFKNNSTLLLNWYAFPLILIKPSIVLSPILRWFLIRAQLQKGVGKNWIYAVVFPFNQLSYILFAVLLYLLSVRQKVAKNSAQNKISHNCLLLTSLKRHPSVGRYLPLKTVRCHSGAPGLVRFSIINKKMLPHFKQPSHLPQNVNGLQL